LTDQNTYTEEEHYKAALDAIFKELKSSAYVTVARWSYVREANNPLLFSPGPVGTISPQQAASLVKEFDKEEFKKTLNEFSFTKLLVENDREIWFHFTKVDPEDDPESIEKQVYLRVVDAGLKKFQILVVSAERVSYALVDEIIKEFEEAGQPNASTYDKGSLSEKRDAMKNTLDAAIFSLFQNEACGIKHIYFLPVVVPAGGKKVAGILSINTSERIDAVSLLVPILQPFAQGIMAPFQLEEIDEQRRKFSLRSAIAAIMSRNMSHNIGSHVLWHLAQELK
jgi:hypothetical protein